jgi:tRNA modification GTPase
MSASSLMLGDTIAAIATAPGEAGLAVLRLSGPDAVALADRVFSASGGSGGNPLAHAPSHTLHHGWAIWPADAAGAAPGPGVRGPDAEPGERLDEVVAAVFRAPRSYTRENVVELSCHGGARSARRLLDALLHAGARLARPGEFTLRAFLNGRLDLAEAEAVADLIHASTDAAHRLALSQLAGALSRELAAIRERLADAVAEVEARVDFAEDVGGVEVPAHVVAAIAAVEDDLTRLLDGVAWARAVRDGVRVPIVGRPNVGKSSLFNALLGEERSIVTALPGTTRDRVSESLELDGVRVTFSDTAGLRENAGPVEAIGIARARAALADSPLAVWVVDGSTALHSEDRAIAGALVDKPVLVAINKMDRAAAFDESAVLGAFEGGAPSAVRVSALTGAGIPALKGELSRLLGAGSGGTRLGAATGNPRHAEALGRARASLGRAREAVRSAMPGEIVALELREALAAIGEVTGDAVGEDILARIFSRFCVGK